MNSEGKQIRNGKAFEYAIATQYYTYLLDRWWKLGIIDNNAIAI